MDNPLFFVALIVAIFVIAMLLPRWIRRSTASAGSRAERRERDSRLDEILDELGATIVIAATEPVAREIIDSVALQQPRSFTILPDGTYGIRFIEPDDAIVRLVSDPDGTRLQVEAFREYLGKPNTSPFWKELRSRAASGAEARKISTMRGPQLRHRRDETGIRWSVAE